MMNSFAIDVVIPVRDMEAHLAECLRHILPQIRPGDRVTVVDDASADRSAEIARSMGARVLTGPGKGPYEARHVAASSTDAPLLLFVDARCRPRPGWIERHRGMLRAPGVGLSCTAVSVRADASVASRVASVQQPFRLDSTIGVRGRLPYFATCNLGVKSSAYRAVGGFRSMRSGADADLCWRIQLAGLGRLVADPEPLVEWLPRQQLTALTEQWYRYGRGNALLDRLFAQVDVPDGLSSSEAGRSGAIRALSVRIVKNPRDLVLVPMVAFFHLVFVTGRLIGRLKDGHVDEPRTLGSVSLR